MTAEFPFHRASRRSLLRGFLGLAAAGPLMMRPSSTSAQGITLPDGRYYDAYTPAASKEGQFYHYTCEFDAAWVVLATFGFDVGFDEQIGIVGHDTSFEPWYEMGPNGWVIYGGDILTQFSGNYHDNLLARTTGQAMMPIFEQYNLQASHVRDRQGIQDTLDQGGLVWMKATADFLAWEPTTWITPEGVELPTVLGNDHAVVAMGYNELGVVIRDVLGPTSSNWERPYEYDIPWETFMGVFGSQNSDGIGVLPPGTAAAAGGRVVESAPAG